MKNLQKILWFAAVFVLFFINSNNLEANTKCNLSRDLTLGDQGEDIRCLQRYLNNSGFIVAPSGVGSRGNETSLFRGLTKEAVIRWQAANGISPATGTFGPKSRAKYSQLILSTSAQPNSTNTMATTNSTTNLNNDDKDKKDSEKLIIKAHETLSTAIGSVNSSGADTTKMKKARLYLDDARLNFSDALEQYFSQKYNKVSGYLNEMTDNTQDALKTAGVKSASTSSSASSSKAKKAISNAENSIEDAEDAVDDSDASSSKIKKAKTLIKDAKKILNKATDALDDRDYGEAIDFAEEAKNLAEDAEDLVS
jgi:peptidoglycan hydrolase-like protein with peptidoglycan-binding domain